VPKHSLLAHAARHGSGMRSGSSVPASGPFDSTAPHERPKPHRMSRGAADLARGKRKLEGRSSELQRARLVRDVLVADCRPGRRSSLGVLANHSHGQGEKAADSGHRDETRRTPIRAAKYLPVPRLKLNLRRRGSCKHPNGAPAVKPHPHWHVTLATRRGQLPAVAVPYWLSTTGAPTANKQAAHDTITLAADAGVMCVAAK
jgi:hypothetical protein